MKRPDVNSGVRSRGRTAARRFICAISLLLMSCTGGGVESVRFDSEIACVSPNGQTSLVFGTDGSVRGRVQGNGFHTPCVYTLNKRKTEGFIREKVGAPYPLYKFTISDDGLSMRIFSVKSGSYIDMLEVQ